MFLLLTTFGCFIFGPPFDVFVFGSCLAFASASFLALFLASNAACFFFSASLFFILPPSPVYVKVLESIDPVPIGPESCPALASPPTIAACARAFLFAAASALFSALLFLLCPYFLRSIRLLPRFSFRCLTFSGSRLEAPSFSSILNIFSL